MEKYISTENLGKKILTSVLLYQLPRVKMIACFLCVYAVLDKLPPPRHYFALTVSFLYFEVKYFLNAFFPDAH